MARSRMPSGCGDVGLVDDLLRFAGRQDVLRQAVFQPGQFDVAGRVVEDVVVAGHPLEPCPDRHQPAVLAAEAQRVAVLLAVVVQVALVALDDRLGDFGRLGDATDGSPVDEVAQVIAADLDGPLRVVLDLHPLEELLHHGDHALRVVGVADGLVSFACVLTAIA